MIRKLNLIYHIKSLDDNCIAKEVFNEQVKNCWPGLAKECSNFCEQLNIPDITQPDINIPKLSWKNLVKKAVGKKNSDELKIDIAGYTKLEDMKDEEKCEMREYIVAMTMQEARTKFRIRTRMINCAMNQPSDPKHIANLWKCTACLNVDTMSLMVSHLQKFTRRKIDGKRHRHCTVLSESDGHQR